MIYYTQIDSPVDTITLTSDGAALTGVYMNEHKHAVLFADEWIRDDQAAPFPEAKRQLEEYFAGARTEFDLPLAPSGTPFQQTVWSTLREIPYGETITYGALAARLGNPNASRAVGLANGRNPISIIVPCHRVIGANGKLVGYGGGLGCKEILLATEKQHPQ
ncbi:methylated-DNA--protein-cysteine methyltransferase [Capsulimonas corticalis]|uniref:Methylated-DNA--protein-cysteine methyltransferase n=1 Tax=Capsulimonas corticalis TaxID=2219043 RepID=A0A402D4G3_9BACT|nr:methylated-DNA--[protein]-cysteine S-methyltransferase [Capsulimonas corticalis]BDI29211.1 methylated-DNA--protein-cysteine methyltransferase [Capsulimonas corticalis]